jgi:hypothetical protein
MDSITRKLKNASAEDWQNISLFAIASFTFGSYLYYNFAERFGVAYWNVMAPFEALIPIVTIHAIADFFVTKSTDVKIHHICVCGFIAFNRYYNVSRDHRSLLLYPLLKTEISSIFYVLKYWLRPNTFIYNVNLAVFYIAFAKLRIYDLYCEVIHDNFPFHVLFQNYSHSNLYFHSIVVLSCYGLYVLNLYWFLIMNKVIYKMLTKTVENLNTDELCHLLCSYLYWLHIPVSLIIYSRCKGEKFVFDLISVIGLSVASFRYHYDVFRRLRDKTIDVYLIPYNSNAALFLNDCVSIHIRSFSAILTNYYNHECFYLAVVLSGCFHGVSLVRSITALQVNNNRDLEDYDASSSHTIAKKSRDFVNYHNVVMSGSIICDVLLIFANSPTHIASPFLMINIIIGLLFIIEPFYKLTHVAVHICLIAHTYYICLSSSGSSV